MKRPFLTVAGLAAAISISSCQDNTGPTPPVYGSVRVTVTTTGADHDPNGYDLFLDNVSNYARPVAASATLLIEGLHPGTHSLLLRGVAPNCEVNGGITAVLNIVAGEVTNHTFAVSCSALANIQITVATTGVAPDTSYVVFAHGSNSFAEGRVSSSGSVTLRVPAGQHMLALIDIAANCDASDPFPQPLTVTSGEVVAFRFQVACAPTSKLVYSVNGDIYAINSNGTGLTQLTRRPEQDEDPSWSPDGSRIAFTSRAEGWRQIFVMRADGSDVRQLTTGAAQNSQAAWSPAGDRIVFVSERDGNRELYVMNADGTQQTRLTNHPADDTDPVWSSTNKIAFTSKRDPVQGIYVAFSDGSYVTRVTPFNGARAFHPAWSPDGSRLAVALDCAGIFGCSSRIVMMNADGSSLTELNYYGDAPVWSPDGRQIAFTSHFCDYYGYTCEPSGIAIVRLDKTGGIGLAGVPAIAPDWQR